MLVSRCLRVLRPRATALLRALAPRRRLFSVDAATAAPHLFAFSEAENMLRDTTSKFAKEVVLPLVPEMDAKQKMDKGLVKDMFENGFMGIEVPEEYGGMGMSLTEAIIAVEELSKVCPSVGLMVDVHNTLCISNFPKFATEKQLERWMPRLAEDTVGCYCLTETTAGSDAFAMKTTAVLSADKSYYTLNGVKLFITNALEAGLFVVFAQTDPKKGYKGITAFVLEKGMKGLSVGKKEDKLGIRASSTCEVVMEDVEVPADFMLGKLGEGYKIAMETLNEGRIGIGAQMIGLAQGALEAALPYVYQRKQFGKFVGTFQGMQFSIAQARTEIEAARLLVYNAARMRDRGEQYALNSAMAKLYASQMAERVASQAVEWLGGVGFTRELPNEKFYRDAKIGSIYEGTSNMQLLTIAKMLEREYI